MKVLIVVIALSASVFSLAQDLDGASTEALKKTQDLLKNKKQRKESIDKDKSQDDMDKKIKELAGDDQTSEEMYGLAADVFEQIVKESKGDVSKMSEILEKYKNNPEAFAQKWTPEQKRRLQNIGNKVKKEGPR